MKRILVALVLTILCLLVSCGDSDTTNTTTQSQQHRIATTVVRLLLQRAVTPSRPHRRRCRLSHWRQVRVLVLGLSMLARRDISMQLLQAATICEARRPFRQIALGM